MLSLRSATIKIGRSVETPDPINLGRRVCGRGFFLGFGLGSCRCRGDVSRRLRICSARTVGACGAARLLQAERSFPRHRWCATDRSEVTKCIYVYIFHCRQEVHGMVTCDVEPYQAVRGVACSLM